MIIEVGLNIIAIIFLACGWGLSSYFYQVYQKRLPDDVYWMPPFLRMTDCPCDQIVETRFGKTFGQPNAVWGLFYYPGFIFLILLNFFANIVPVGFLFIISIFSFTYSIYLAFGLYTLRVVCKPCIGVHVVSLFVFLIFLGQML